jgi:hypothetical protein
MAKKLKRPGQFAELLRRSYDSCVQPKGLRKIVFFSKQMKRQRIMSTDLIKFYTLLSYSDICYFNQIL